MKALEILKKLLKNKYENRPLLFGFEKHLGELEDIHEAIEELEKIPMFLENKYILGYCQGYSDKTVNAKELHTLSDLKVQ